MKAPQWWYKSLYDLHSALGVSLGVIFFAIVFSGTVAVWSAELMHWEYGALRDCAPGEMTVQQAIDKADEQLGLSGTQFAMFLPDDVQSCITLQRLNKERWNGIEWLHIDPADEQEPTFELSGMTWLFVRMHTNFVAQNAIGRYASGLVGILFLLSAVAGLLMHRRIREQAYSLNTGGSARKVAADLHKGVGVWAFPFHLLMGLTGAWVGLAGIVTAVMGIATLGSQEALIEAVIGPPAKPTGRMVDMVDVDELVEQAVAEVPGGEPSLVLVEHWKDEGARVDVHLRRGDRLGDRISLKFDGDEGTLLRTTDFSEGSPYEQLYATIAPLHYATFGGTPLKLLYYLLGCVMCVLIASGLHVWIVHRQQGRDRPSAWPPRLSAGGCVGIVVATAFLLAVRDFYPAWLDPFLLSAGLYFAIWLAVIGVALAYRGTLRRFVGGCALLTAALLVAAAAVRAFGDPHALGDMSTLVIEVMLVGSALALWGFARRIGSPRRALTGETLPTVN